MALREYAHILLRYGWLILLLPLLAGAFSLLTYREPPVTWGHTLQYSVSFLPAPREDMDQDPRLGAVQASEYIADDLTEIVRGSRFTEAVQQYLPESTPASISAATRAEKVHRLVTVDLTADTEPQASALAAAVHQAIENDLEPLLGDLWGTGELRMERVHDSGSFPVGGGLRSRLDVPLRVALALVAAVALAFALDFLDDSIRTRAEAERLAGPVLGEIPK